MTELSDERLREALYRCTNARLRDADTLHVGAGFIETLCEALRELLARRERERAEAAAVEQAVAPIRARLERVVAAMSRRPDDD